MKIIVSNQAVLPAPAPSPAIPLQVLPTEGAVPSVDIKAFEESLLALTRRLDDMHKAMADIQQTLRDLPKTVSATDIAGMIRPIAQKVQSTEKSLESLSTAVAALNPLGARLDALEKQNTQALITTRVKELVASEMAARPAPPAPIPTPAPVAETWDTIFQERQTNLVTLQQDVETGLRLLPKREAPIPPPVAVSVSAPISIPATAPSPVAPPEIPFTPLAHTQPEDEPETLTSARPSKLAQIWTYLNRPAVEIPITRNKFE